MRFPEFSGEWENKTLKSVLKCHDNFRIPLSDKQRKNMKGQYAYYGANGIIDFIDKFIFNGNYILLAEDGGKFDEFRTKPIAHKASGKFWVNNHAHVLSTNNILDFVFYQLEHKDIRSFINIGSRSKLNKNDMFNIIISLCSLKEQSKIANFLSLIDKRIELQNKIIRDYKLLKKGIQNYFFKNINSDNSYSLSCFLEEYTLKNLKNNLQVVSVGKYGIRQRNEIYSKVLSDDLSKNKVIFQDTLTIGMGTKQIDFGILSKNVEYCVSPAYRTYKIKNINSEYLKYYLEIINNQLSRKYMIISARQGTTIDNKSFLKHQLVVHPILKQNYIVNVINIIRKYLTISDDILETHKDLKKYLLKHIFI